MMSDFLWVEFSDLQQGHATCCVHTLIAVSNMAVTLVEDGTLGGSCTTGGGYMYVYISLQSKADGYRSLGFAVALVKGGSLQKALVYALLLQGLCKLL